MRACAFSALSLTTSHKAAMETCGTAEKLPTSDPPRPPTPITPRRTVSFFSKGIPETLRPGCCASDEGAPRPAPAIAANRNRSRRPNRPEFIGLPPETFDHPDYDQSADDENGQQRGGVAQSSIE